MRPSYYTYALFDNTGERRWSGPVFDRSARTLSGAKRMASRLYKYKQPDTVILIHEHTSAGHYSQCVAYRLVKNKKWSTPK